MTLGHLAIAGIAKQTYFEKESLLFLSLAAFGPDLVDKPLSAFLTFPTHGLGHSLILFFAALLTVWLLRRQLVWNGRTVFAGVAMWGSHLFADSPPFTVLSWPFGEQWGLNAKWHVAEGFWQFYVDRMYPAKFQVEIACVMILLILLFLKHSPTSTVGAKRLMSSVGTSDSCPPFTH